MTAPDEKTLYSMLHISTDPKASAFLQWLSDSLREDSIKSNHQTDAAESLVEKGRNQRTEEILKTIQSAQDQLDDINKNKARNATAGRGAY